MVGVAESTRTADLQLESLELDLKTLRQERDEDRKEFHQFQTIVNRNFITMQIFFDKIQDNFRRLLLDPDRGKDDEDDHASVQGAAVQKDNPVGSDLVAPGRPKQLVADTPPSVTIPEKAAVGGVGTQGQVITFVDETVPLEKITESKDKASRLMEQVALNEVPDDQCTVWECQKRYPPFVADPTIKT
ncbi:hypothetical protein D1007_13963 [Hordeum vulgare]|nr:hypothetical protein D1007_13963 [Hordeum vulgare]